MGRAHPNAKVTVACGKLCTSLFEGFPNVERVIPMVKRPWHGHWIDLWKQTSGTRWDIIVDLRNSAVSRLLRADQRYIFGKHIDKKSHKVEQMAQVMDLGIPPAPALHFTEVQREFAERLIAGDDLTICVGPAANWIGKTWPAERFIEVIQWMTAPGGVMAGARVAVFAAPGEEAQARLVLESVPADKRIDGIAKGTPGEAAAAIARCDFYIGNDSGLMHAAAAGGVKTLGLFGPSYPHLYRPWGDHTTYVQTPETFDQLIDFPGYDPKTLDRTLMNSLQTKTVIDIIKKQFDSDVPEYNSPAHTAYHSG